MHKEDVESFVSAGNAECNHEYGSGSIALAQVGDGTCQLDDGAVSGMLSLPGRHHLQGQGIEGVSVEQVGQTQTQGDCYVY